MRYRFRFIIGLAAGFVIGARRAGSATSRSRRWPGRQRTTQRCSRRPGRRRPRRLAWPGGQGQAGGPAERSARRNPACGPGEQRPHRGRRPEHHVAGRPGTGDSQATELAASGPVASRRTGCGYARPARHQPAHAGEAAAGAVLIPTGNGITQPMSPLSGVLADAWSHYRRFARAFPAHRLRHLRGGRGHRGPALAGRPAGTSLGSIVSVIAAFLVQAALVKAVQDVRDGRVNLNLGRDRVRGAAIPARGGVASILAGIGIAIGLALIIVPGLILLTFWSLIVPCIVIGGGASSALRPELADRTRLRVAGVRHLRAGVPDPDRVRHRARPHPGSRCRSWPGASSAASCPAPWSRRSWPWW